MPIDTLDKGSVLAVQGTFTDAGGVVDPGAVFARVLPPSGVPVTYTYGAPGSPITRISEGVYRVEVPFTVSGRWVVRIESTAPGAAGKEREYFVRQSAFQ